jgi:hypothetical protein
MADLPVRRYRVLPDIPMKRKRRPYFECIATIDAGFFMLEQHLKQEAGRSPLDRLIDDASGYDREKREWVRVIAQDIRDAQAEIGEDTTETDKVLAAIDAIPPTP